MTTGLPIFTWDNTDVRLSVRSLLEKYSPPQVVRDAEEGKDVQVWDQLVAGGWHMLAVPEDLGGMGVGAVELNFVLFELGRSCAPAPFRTAAVGVAAFMANTFGNDPGAQLLVKQVGEGEIWVPVVDETVGHRAAPEFDGTTVTGHAALVRDAQGATGFVVAARTSAGGVAWVSIDADAAGIQATPQASLGEDRQSSLQFDRTPASLIVEAGEESLRTWLTWRWFAEASFASGLMARALEHAVEYVGTREQFGRKIGSFQAVQHQLADCAIAVQAVANLSREAALTIDAVGATTSEAQACAAEALEWARHQGRVVSTHTHQVMAGTGYALEHNMQLVTRRLRSALLWGADSEDVRETILAARYPSTTEGI